MVSPWTGRVFFEIFDRAEHKDEVAIDRSKSASMEVEPPEQQPKLDPQNDGPATRTRSPKDA